MKTTIWISLLLAALSACGHEIKPQANTAAKTAGVSRESFFDSPTHSQAEYLAETEKRLSERTPLPTAVAERCWERESKREKIRNACVLLWALGSTASNLLESYLVENAAKDPILAAAAVLHGKTISSWSAPTLLTVLKGIKDSPVWLRARATSIWASNRHIDTRLADQLVALVAPEEALIPADFYQLNELFHLISPGAEAALFRDHCSHNAVGEIRLRCWRFLSTIKNQTANAIFLPRSREEDWDFFRRNSPHRARILETNQ